MCVIGCDHNNVVRRKRCAFRRHGVECAPCSIGAFKPLTTCIVLKIIIVVSRVRAIAAAELSSSAAAPIVIIIIIWPGKRCAKKNSRAHALTLTHYIHVLRTHTLDSTHMSHAIQTQPVFNKCVYFALRARRRRYTTLLVRTHTYTGCCPRRGFTNGIRRGRHVCSTASLLPAYSEKPKTLILGRRRSAQFCCIQGTNTAKLITIITGEWYCNFVLYMPRRDTPCTCVCARGDDPKSSPHPKSVLVTWRHNQ